MDGPFVSLDDPTATDLRELLMDLWHRRPTTVLFITHARREAVTLGTRILRLAGASASIVQDEPINLTRSERSNPDRVAAEVKRIFGDA
jgi:NitT/TauT family transport system ATP-binding protein